ncbi:hypothetical protein Q9L58_009956, partial [Maublancomyces gigas]
MANNRLNAAQKAVFDRTTTRFTSPTRLLNSLNTVAGHEINTPTHANLWILYDRISKN